MKAMNCFYPLQDLADGDGTSSYYQPTVVLLWGLKNFEDIDTGDVDINNKLKEILRELKDLDFLPTETNIKVYKRLTYCDVSIIINKIGIVNLASFGSGFPYDKEEIIDKFIKSCISKC